MASALMPFPDRAGAASSLLGICQMTFAAIVGILLGRNLDASAIPLPATIATTGVLALVLFLDDGTGEGSSTQGLIDHRLAAEHIGGLVIGRYAAR